MASMSSSRTSSSVPLLFSIGDSSMFQSSSVELSSCLLCWTFCCVTSADVLGMSRDMLGMSTSESVIRVGPSSVTFCREESRGISE